MAAVQADLLVLPPIAGHIAAPGDRRLGRLAKGCGAMRVPVTGVGRTVGATRRSRSKMGRDPTDRVLDSRPQGGKTQGIKPQGGAPRADFKQRSPRDDFQGRASRDGGPERLSISPQRSGLRGGPIIRPTRPKARSGCMATMQLPPPCQTQRAGCAGYL